MELMDHIALQHVAAEENIAGEKARKMAQVGSYEEAAAVLADFVLRTEPIIRGRQEPSPEPTS